MIISLVGSGNANGVEWRKYGKISILQVSADENEIIHEFIGLACEKRDEILCRKVNIKVHKVCNLMMMCSRKPLIRPKVASVTSYSMKI